MASSVRTKTVGIVGARGYVGREFAALVEAHPALELSMAASSSQAGRSVRDALGAGDAGLRFVASEAGAIAGACPDVLILALPNGHAQAMLESIERAGGTPELVLDLSADMRFDGSWTYCVPELHGERVAGAERISNPGCYATAMQLALWPVRERLVGLPHCFGVSGYSGAGSKPSEKNDEARLTGGVLPYALAGHTHEREVSHQLGRAIRFAPSVAPFFRGIVLTAMFELESPTDAGTMSARFASFYAEHPLVRSIGERMPRVQEVVGTPGAVIGGITVDGAHPNRVSVVCVIDNLLKGAASQAVQNINLALGLEPLAGVRA